MQKLLKVTPGLVQDKVTTCIGECASVNRYCVSYALCCVPADPGIGVFFFFFLQFVHEKEIVAEDDQVFLMKQQVMFCP